MGFGIVRVERSWKLGSWVDCFSATTAPQEATGESCRAFNEEAALVRRAQASDETAFREIVERYQARVFSIIHRTLRDRNEAEDIAQEVFANAFLSIRRYKCQGSLLSWIYRITVNECYEYLRRKKVRPLVYEGDLKKEDEDRTYEARSHDRPVDAALADRDLAVKLLARVSEQERFLLLMREVEGYSIQELSKITGMNENSLKVKLFRARQKLLKLAPRNLRAVRRSA
jgi:RNA polymerase sigma-70 factor (ECF subfamily)